jgi:hypothetical protein
LSVEEAIAVGDLVSVNWRRSSSVSPEGFWYAEFGSLDESRLEHLEYVFLYVNETGTTVHKKFSIILRESKNAPFDTIKL